jgi:hypothetical protein
MLKVYLLIIVRIINFLKQNEKINEEFSNYYHILVMINFSKFVNKHKEICVKKYDFFFATL